MARLPTLSFDRGTLLLHPPPPGKAWIDYVTWDDRVERFRLQALHYRRLVEVLRAEGMDGLLASLARHFLSGPGQRALVDECDAERIVGFMAFGHGIDPHGVQRSGVVDGALDGGVVGAQHAPAVDPGKRGQVHF